MGKAILAVNAGTSSVSVTVYTFDQPPSKLASAKVAGLTSPPPIFKCSLRSNYETSREIEDRVDSPQRAFKYLTDHFLNDAELQKVNGKIDFAYVCHRVVHGGDFQNAVLINDETKKYLRELTELAPLHNAVSLDIIEACLREIPGAKTAAYFDTTFHQCLPSHVKAYPIDPEKAKSKRLRKYGFHGISYSFILRSVAGFLKKTEDSTSIIALHLGSGASICAIRNGQPIDTSMGLTPLAGLPGASRSGDIDPSLVFHYAPDASERSSLSSGDVRITVAEEILNKKAGWKALTGTTDFSQIATENPASERHQLALDILVDRIVGFIGSYFVKLDGHVDALVFAGGLGEKSALLRKAIVEKCQSVGFAVDQDANANGPGGKATVTDVSEKPEQVPAVLICQTSEEFEMAYQCVNSPPRNKCHDIFGSAAVTSHRETNPLCSRLAARH